MRGRSSAMKKTMRVLRDQKGAETLEWILIAGIIVLLGFAVYGPAGGPLKTALDSAIQNVSSTLTSGTAPGGK
jgi:Flp pilus assembly pilin Flp